MLACLMAFLSDNVVSIDFVGVIRVQGMDKSCTGCKQYIAHQYWDHMDNRKKCFFKPMFGDLEMEL